MIKRLSTLALAAGLLVFSAQASASALEQFKSFVASTQAAKGEFTQRQVKTDRQGKMQVSDVSQGRFQFARPGRFIWLYQKPYEQLLQSDGEQLYIYDKDLNQVTIRSLGEALASSPAAILFGSNDVEKNFVLKEGGSRDGLDWLQLTPRAKDSPFEQIGIGLQDGTPLAMELRDAFGQVSLLTFQRFEKNPPLSSSQFKFDLPKGADVFRQ